MSQRSGLVFGCYDPLHYGHIRLFRACRKQCDRLIVVVHDDDYIRRYKSRAPHVPVKDRVEDIKDLSTVSHVVINHDESRSTFVNTFHPDVVFLSEEVQPSRLDVGPGVEVVWMPRTPGVSSTALRVALPQDGK